jgi:hypothetical protein
MFPPERINNLTPESAYHRPLVDTSRGEAAPAPRKAAPSGNGGSAMRKHQPSQPAGRRWLVTTAAVKGSPLSRYVSSPSASSNCRQRAIWIRPAQHKEPIRTHATAHTVDALSAMARSGGDEAGGPARRSHPCSAFSSEVLSEQLKRCASVTLRSLPRYRRAAARRAKPRSYARRL